MSKYTVKLASVGNPDHGQDPTQPLWGVEDRTASVDSLEEASSACRDYIGENELGGGNWSGGQVYDEGGQIVAYISYNGRIWTEPKDFPYYVREEHEKLTKK